MTRQVAFTTLFLIASFCMPVHADEGNPRFTLALPPASSDASRIHLVLEGVTVPGDQPLKLRVISVTDRHQTVVLGSAGIVAARPTMSEPRRLPLIRLDVTQALKTITGGRERTPQVIIEVEALDGHNLPLKDLRWSIDRVRLEMKSP